ncbi:ABC transporter substrate-binding protein [Bordetella petrii]|uniref:ABC transporter substrate-binding protein n=1 Tax=Bordetella petrii TaxID=94624 RepID=UPI003AF3D446
MPRLRMVQVEPSRRAAALADGQVDLLLADRIEGRSTAGLDAPDVLAVPAGYAARPKAVIRSDTQLESWKQVQGHSVCMATAAFQAQELAARWGATVRTYRVPSDALVAVREGACDIGLVDDAMWSPLMKFPEWKKFSSTLPADGPRAERIWLVSARDRAGAAWLADAMQDWRGQGAWKGMTDKWARDVAFDVYLDQEVPDCHGG